jgi:hypothetical protein
LLLRRVQIRCGENHLCLIFIFSDLLEGLLVCVATATRRACAFLVHSAETKQETNASERRSERSIYQIDRKLLEKGILQYDQMKYFFRHLGALDYQHRVRHVELVFDSQEETYSELRSARGRSLMQVAKIYELKMFGTSDAFLENLRNLRILCFLVDRGDKVSIRHFKGTNIIFISINTLYGLCVNFCVFRPQQFFEFEMLCNYTVLKPRVNKNTV